MESKKRIDLLIYIQNIDNRYKFVCYERQAWMGRRYIRDVVTLHDHGSRIELPSRELLQLHAAIAKILNMTAAGEIIDRVLRDREDINVLAQDGSTNIEFLMHMLTAH